MRAKMSHLGIINLFTAEHSEYTRTPSAEAMPKLKTGQCPICVACTPDCKTAAVYKGLISPEFPSGTWTRPFENWHNVLYRV